jgi:hypothetical protein
MKKRMFEELLESVKEAGKILRGEREPSRVFIIANKEDEEVIDKSTCIEHTPKKKP